MNVKRIFRLNSRHIWDILTSLIATSSLVWILVPAIKTTVTIPPIEHTVEFEKPQKIRGRSDHRPR